MIRISENRLFLRMFALLVVAVVCLTTVSRAERPGWQRRDVDWRTTGGGRIKAIYYPEEGNVPALKEQVGQRLTSRFKTAKPMRIFSQDAQSVGILSVPPIINVIDSPPIDGFIPRVVVSVTDKRLPELDLDAIPESFLVGGYPTGVNPQTDYAVGIFDTGTSAHLMSFADATRAGLFNSSRGLVTSNTTIVSGVIGVVDAWVSQPLGLFIDGLGAIDPDNLLLDTSGMVGESNVSIIVGQNPVGGPDLPTVIGSPLSVFFTTVIYNDKQITITRDGDEFISPDIHIYEHDDLRIPSYPNIIPLELRPLGAYAVQYIPSLEGFFEFPPMSPSVVIGNLSQSLFFVHSVDVAEGTQKAIDKDRFMFDTGAQVTVIGSRIAARLKLDTNNPDFEVEIQDVTGEIVVAPGFYIDSLEIPALGEWLGFTNIPVVLLDVASPEGGTLDGVIGMNLFVGLNIVLRGGGIFLEDDPVLEFAPIGSRIEADIAPIYGDGVVNFRDLAAIADAWLSTSDAPNWDNRADIAPRLSPDGIINFLDYSIFTNYWQEKTNP